MGFVDKLAIAMGFNTTKQRYKKPFSGRHKIGKNDKK
jgi:hypothetical protein